MKYKKRVQEVEAWAWDESGETLNTIGCGFMSCSGHAENPDLMKNLRIYTELGVETINKGDFIVKASHGKFYAFDPETFKDLYEPVETTNKPVVY